MIDREAIKRNISANIKDLLAEKGLSQAELSRMSNLTEMYVSRVVRGAVDPSSSGLASIANALQVTTDRLLKDSETKARQSA